MEDPATATVSGGSPSHYLGHPFDIDGGVDSISSLPDEILQQILSFIPTKFAISTSVLSKRWKHVWCETPCIDFDWFGSSGESISKTLASYTAAKITNFRLRSIRTNKIWVQLVNSSIKIAMSRNTEELSLEVCSFNIMDYSFPDFLFSNSSLKELILDTGYGLISPRCTVSWTSLKSLSLSSCILSAESFSKMLSGCPMLESLTFMYIDSIEYLDLSKSPRLKRLDIDLLPFGSTVVQIVAPHIHSLRLRNLRAARIHESQSYCTLVDVSSLTEADIDFKNSWYDMYPWEFVAVHAMVQTMLEKLHNVEILTLGVNFLQILSMAEFRGVPFPMFKVKNLTLETRILRSVVPGIARLLQNSPELKKITLYAIECSTKADTCVNHYLDKQDLDLDQCRRLIDVVSPASGECEVAEPELVASFVELLLANTRTLESLVLQLGRYFDRSRLRELSEITHTLSHNNNVSIVIK